MAILQLIMSMVVLGAAMAFASDEALFVLNKSDGTVSIVDTGTGDSLATLQVGLAPHEAAASADGQLVVVCNYGDREHPGSTLSVIDAPARRVKRTIDLGEHHRPHGVQFLGKSHRVAVTTEAEKKLLIVNLDSGQIEASIDTDAETSHMVTIAQGDRAFVANIGSGSVSVIDLEKSKLLKVIPTGKGAEGIAASPSGAEVWVTNRDAETVSVIDARSLEVVEEIACASFPIRVAFTPDGEHALVSCARSGDVAVFNAATRKQERRIKMDAEAVRDGEKEKRLFGDKFGESPVPIGILIEPGGKFAYIANTNADIITMIDLSTWRIAKRLKAGQEPDGLAWARSGQ